MRGRCSLKKVLREEKKYLLSCRGYYSLKYSLEQVLTSDEHNKKDGYMVRSLYFDTLDNKDYNEKIEGVEKRKKIRLRIYDTKAETAFLEIKQKDGMYQEKRSLEVTRRDAKELIHGNYQVLLNYDNAFAKECYALLIENNYRPKTVVEYQRIAFIAKENNIRITFDSNIRATESNLDIFDEHLLLYPVFYQDQVILEVKYNGFLLSYVKALVNQCNKSPLSVSKYCLARKVSLGFVY